MPTATHEVFRDTEPLFTGTHKGGSGTSRLSDPGAMFKVLGANVDLSLFVENTTQSTGAYLSQATNDSLVATGLSEEGYFLLDEAGFPYSFISGSALSWDYGDTYKVYATSSKGSKVGDMWCDVSRGWKINPQDKIIDGWRKEDADLDGKNRAHVFGPGQPE